MDWARGGSAYWVARARATRDVKSRLTAWSCCAHRTPEAYARVPPWPEAARASRDVAVSRGAVADESSHRPLMDCFERSQARAFARSGVGACGTGGASAREVSATATPWVRAKKCAANACRIRSAIVRSSAEGSTPVAVRKMNPSLTAF